jgi:hypothetical protein
MALGCPRCGTQNPDGNLYCQACGTPLSVPVAAAVGAPPGPPPGFAPPAFAPPPPGIPPPMVAPGGYQSPYYAPGPPGAPVHRLPWMMIIGGVVALAVVLAGVGTALALVGNHSPAAANSTVGDAPPTPTPGVSPRPVASPTTTSTTGLESNDAFSLNLPSGWSVDSKDNESMVLADPNGQGSVTVASGVSLPTQTAQQNLDTIVNELKAKFPDTRYCSGGSPTGSSLSGAAGLSFTLCFTLTSGANSVPAAAAVFAGANAGGTIYYLAMIVTTQDNLKSYIATAAPVLHSVHWKLS